MKTKREKPSKWKKYEQSMRAAEIYKGEKHWSKLARCRHQKRQVWEIRQKKETLILFVSLIRLKCAKVYFFCRDKRIWCVVGTSALFSVRVRARWIVNVLWSTWKEFIVVEIMPSWNIYEIIIITLLQVFVIMLMCDAAHLKNLHVYCYLFKMCPF